MPKIERTLPISLVSPNTMEHWTKRHRRNKINANAVYFALGKELKLIQGNVAIKLIRVCRRFYDFDNLVFAFKGIRDMICEMITGKKRGHGDNNPRFTWEYAQEKGKPNGIRIEITYDS